MCVLRPTHTHTHSYRLPRCLKSMKVLPVSAASLPLPPRASASQEASPGWRAQKVAGRRPKSQQWQTHAERRTKMGTGRCAQGAPSCPRGELGTSRSQQEIRWGAHRGKTKMRERERTSNDELLGSSALNFSVCWGGIGWGGGTPESSSL